MSFFFTLGSDDKTLLHGAKKADENLAIVGIGYDSEADITYKVLVALVAVTAQPSNFRELFFLVIEVSNNDRTTIEHNSGQHTKEFLNKDQRTIVLSAIASVASILVEKEDVEVLIINTVETHLPDKALTKYEKICEKIRSLGYIGGKVDSYRGSEQWILKKSK